MNKLSRLTMYPLLMLISACFFVGCEMPWEGDDDDDSSSSAAGGDGTELGAVAGDSDAADADDGDATTTSTASGAYASHVADFKAKYGKSNEWESWMLANSSRYESAYNAAKGKPGTITINFRYETDPLNYNPAWSSEGEHMAKLTTMAKGAYPGYNFNFVFNGGSGYANVIAGTAGTTSYASGKSVYLYYETIFNHEFAHVMRIPHHYGTSGVGDGGNMPPGDSKCLMDRTATLFCSGCKTALRIPLDAVSTASVDGAMNDILSRYPSSGESRYVSGGGGGGGGGAAPDPEPAPSGGGLIYGLKPVP